MVGMNYHETVLIWPDCGCETAQDCLPCPNCGMCVASVQNCLCCGWFPEDGDPVGYDIYADVSGG